MLREWWSWLRFFVVGRKRAELDEDHLERQTEGNLAARMSSAEAQRQAAIGFGSRERAREEYRAQRPSFVLESARCAATIDPVRALRTD